jgi:adenine-specific DNA-methyltransferase
LENIENGTFVVTGRSEEGALELSLGERKKAVAPRTVWSLTSHFARDHGSHLLRRLIGERRFPFPKALYAVEDTLRFVVGDKPNAIVLDFFAGSGTTAHAVARLNKQDGGQRQSVLVTNNEVSADEAESLRQRGHQPGDAEWEALGIFEHITRPRIEGAITGRMPDGKPARGDYKFVDEFPLSDGFEENVEFLELTYLNADDIEIDRAFSGIAPLLWLRAGACGPVIDECLDAAGRRKPYAWTERYGVLFNPDRWRSFVERLPASATTVFIVTNSQTIFQGIAAELPDSLDLVRLYENYLTTFAINRGLS